MHITVNVEKSKVRREQIWLQSGKRYCLMSLFDTAHATTGSTNYQLTYGDSFSVLFCFKY